ncbi:MAG: polysaccharide biosynthesis C-terminal domain-containing protein [Bacteroidia bacterium]
MSSIKKQGIQNTIITYTGVVIGFISLLFVQPNLLKPDELGLTRILVAAASLIATILPLGISGVTTRFFPYFRNTENRHYGYFGFMLLFPIIGTILCGFLIVAFKNTIIGQYTEQSALFTQFYDLLLPFSVIISLNMIMNAYCASLFKTAIISFFEGIFTRVLFIILIVIYYFGWVNFTQFVYLFMLIYLLQLVSMIVYILSIDKPSLKVDITFLKSVGLPRLLQFGIILTVSNFSSIGLKHLDTLVLGRYMSLDYVGIFAVSAYIAMIIEIPLTSLEKITHAKVAQGWANSDIEGIKQIYYQSIKYLLLLGGLLLIGIITNIHDLLKLLPEAYHQGATVVIITSIGAFLNIATGVNTSILFTSEKYIYGTYLMIMLFVLSLTLNIIFIPLYGIEGAALATLIASVIYNTLKYFIIWRSFKMQPYDTSTLKILLAIGITFGLAYILPAVSNNEFISIAIRAIVTCSIYVGLAYYLKLAPELYKHFPWKIKNENSI